MQKKIKFFIIKIYNLYKKVFRINEKRILITSNTKEYLYGNLLYIYDELKKYDYSIKIIVFNDKKVLKKIINEFKILYYLAISKYIILDDFFPLINQLEIKKEIKIIQVWHALGAYKKMGFSRSDVENKNKLDHQNYTDVIVSSNYVIKNYQEAFNIKRENIHPIGIPRTDLFFNKKLIDKKINSLYLKYPKFKYKKIILFAPTFRGNKGKDTFYYPNKYINLEKIYKTLSDDDLFIIKMHPFITNKIQIEEKYKDKIVDLTNFLDINELLLITDLLITDYSSVIFEYAFLKRPIIYYVPDLLEYESTRDFYYDFFDYVYGSVAMSLTDLCKMIKKPNLDLEKLEIFYKKFLDKCDGKSTKRFVELIVKGN